MAKKSVHRPEFDAIVSLLSEARVDAGLTQTELAQKLGATQSFVSAAERRDRRIDLLQAAEWARACGLTMAELGARIDSVLPRRSRKPTRSRAV